MTLRVSGKNLDIGEALRSQVLDRMAGALSKYFDGGYSGHVTVTRDGAGFRTDCVLHLTSGMTLEASGAAQDAYGSFDQTALRIEKRLRRYKSRLRERDGAGAAGPGEPGPDRAIPDMAVSVIQAPGEDEEEGAQPLVIAETRASLRSLSVREAVADLDLTGVPVLVFRHAGSGRVNLVYRRTDGNIGWIDPPAPGADQPA